MRIKRDPSFKKAFKNRIKNNPKLVKKTIERIAIFVNDPKSPIIKDHQLTGDRRQHRAFWITGDIRIIYFPVSKNEVIFVDIGTHNQVY